MTKRDFFILIIRIFALYWFVQTVVFLLPGQLILFQNNNDVMMVLWLIGIVVLILALLIVLLVFSNKLVDLLKLSKGFDDNKIELGTIKSFDFYRIGIFFIGGIFMLRQLSALLHGVLAFFKADQVGHTLTSSESLGLVSNVLTVFIGFLLLTNSGRIAKWFAKNEQTID